MTSDLLEWSEETSIGIPDIDEEHKELLGQYNAIIDALAGGSELSRVREQIGGFLECARRHFANEERFMLDIRYPNYVKHKAEHNKLLMDAEDFVLAIGDALFEEDCPAIAKYFKSWLLRHLENEDRKIVAFLNSSDAA